MAPMYDIFVGTEGQIIMAPDSPSSIPRFVEAKGIPFNDLRQPAVFTKIAGEKISDKDSYQNFVGAYENAARRVDILMANLQSCVEENKSESLALIACFSSLKSRMPLLLHQTKELIENSKSDGSRCTLIGKLRAKYALVRTIQYLNNIEEGIDHNAQEKLNEQLKAVQEGLTKDYCPYGFKPSFRVSPWVPTSLAFDLTLGQSAKKSIEGDCDNIPLMVEVEPIVEFRVGDKATIQAARDAAIPCKVKIEKCTHRALRSHAGAGIIGEACLRVRLSPLDDSNDKSLSVWGSDKQVSSIFLREAQAVQTNSYPPKPKTSVDVFSSYTYGDASVELTLVLQTSMTKNGETPDLHINLFLAPPQQV